MTWLEDYFFHNIQKIKFIKIFRGILGMQNIEIGMQNIEIGVDFIINI